MPGCAGHVERGPPGADPFEAANAIHPGESTRGDVHVLLGDPWNASAKWHAEVFHRQVSAQRYLVAYVIWPAGRANVDQYLLVTYSDSDVVTGIKRYDWDCDWRCGEELEEGTLNGLELASWDIEPTEMSFLRLPPVLMASAEDSEKLASAMPANDQCALYVVPTTYKVSVLYLDDHLVQWGGIDNYFRLSLDPGEHSLTCLVGDRWVTETVQGSTLKAEDDYETRPDWTGSCDAGARVFVKTVTKRSAPWWNIWGVTQGFACELADMSEKKARKALKDRLMIIPYDLSEQRNDESPQEN